MSAPKANLYVTPTTSVCQNEVGDASVAPDLSVFTLKYRKQIRTSIVAVRISLFCLAFWLFGSIDNNAVSICILVDNHTPHPSLYTHIECLAFGLFVFLTTSPSKTFFYSDLLGACNVRVDPIGGGLAAATARRSGCCRNLLAKNRFYLSLSDID